MMVIMAPMIMAPMIMARVAMIGMVMIVVVIVLVAMMRMGHGLILHAPEFCGKRKRPGARSGGGWPSLTVGLGCPPVVVVRETRRLRLCRLMDVAGEQVRDVGAGDPDIGKRTVVEGAQLIIGHLATPPVLIGRLKMLQAGKN